jgi:hypothetical protein
MAILCNNVCQAEAKAEAKLEAECDCEEKYDPDTKCFSCNEEFFSSYVTLLGCHHRLCYDCYELLEHQEDGERFCECGEEITEDEIFVINEGQF